MTTRFLFLFLSGLLAMDLRATVRPYLSDDIPWLIQHASVVVTISPLGVVFTAQDRGCSTVQFEIESVIKTSASGDANVIRGARVRALDRDEVIRGRCRDDQCDLAGVVVYLTSHESSICGIHSLSVLGVTAQQTGGAVSDRVREYLEVTDKIAWARAAIGTRSGDADAARVAVAVALEGDPRDGRVQDILSFVTLNEDLPATVRMEALKVLDTTNSPVRNSVIQRLQETAAPQMMKHQSIRYLDDPSSQLLMSLMERHPDLAGVATRVILERKGASVLRQLGITTLPVSDPAAVVTAAIQSVIRSRHSAADKTESVRVLIGRVPSRSQATVLDSVRNSLTTEQKKMLDKIAKEIQP